mgnify:CR=1 FL=1
MSPYFFSLLRRTMRKPFFWFFLFVVGAVVTMLVSVSVDAQRHEQSNESATVSFDFEKLAYRLSYDFVASQPADQ